MTVPTLRGAGITPACPHCGHSEFVRRMWAGDQKMWYCDIHFEVTSTAKKEMTFMDRLLHRVPEPDKMHYSEVFPNRAARRRQRGK